MLIHIKRINNSDIIFTKQGLIIAFFSKNNFLGEKNAFLEHFA